MRSIIANLTPALVRQDHTISPYEAARRLRATLEGRGEEQRLFVRLWRKQHETPPRLVPFILADVVALHAVLHRYRGGIFRVHHRELPFARNVLNEFYRRWLALRPCQNQQEHPLRALAGFVDSDQRRLLRL